MADADRAGDGGRVADNLPRWLAVLLALLYATFRLLLQTLVIAVAPTPRARMDSGFESVAIFEELRRRGWGSRAR